MIKRVLALLFILCNLSFVYASTQKYTISVCTTVSLENALSCKYRILAEDVKSDVFIVKENEKYFTNLGVFIDENSARYAIEITSSYVKKQKPYIKKISNEIITLKSKNEQVIDLTLPVKEIAMNNETAKKQSKNDEKIIDLISNNPKMQELELIKSYPFDEGQKLNEPIKKEKKPIIYTKEELAYIEELKQVTMEEFDKADEIKEQKTINVEVIKPKEIIKETKIIKTQNIEVIEKTEKENKIEKIKQFSLEKEDNKENPFLNIAKYEEILIEVDSINNFMSVKAKIDNQIKDIKTYKVSTGKDDVKKPFGAGKVSKISLNPIWYPTENTIKSFKKRGINLPKVIPPGHKYNYMGSAKINLTHEVDGKNTYRIHGTLNEKTIGTNESAGCIRMKNGDVVQLATLLNQFSSLRSLNDVKVVLK